MAALSAPRVVYVITHPISARHLLRGQMAYLQRSGFEVILITSAGADLHHVGQADGVPVVPVRMEREMHPVRDLAALLRIARVLRVLRPEIVHASTPKAGLLGSLAAWLVRVPVRIYLLRGLRLETTRGWKRHLLAATERVASAAATRILCVGQSLREKAVELRLTSAGKSTVLASGSSNGVEAGRFLPDPARREQAEGLRQRLGVPPQAKVVGFVGRFTRDKGLPELLEAFDLLAPSHAELRLLLLGDFEPGDPVPASVAERLGSDPRILRPGFVPDTAPYYAAMDVLAFPSHREGFPNVPLEAAAAGVPVVGFRATGTLDAVQDAVTGTLVPLGDAPALARALDGYLGSPALCRQHGDAGQQRVVSEFGRQRVWAALEHECRRLLKSAATVSSRPRRDLQTALAAARRIAERPPLSKRLVDVGVSASFLVLAAPFLAALLLLVRVKLGTPVFFRQQRPGLHGRPFFLYKLRTMTDERDPQGVLLPDEQRLTPFGRWLRATSLDELPELWNVLQGQLSLVGPRPLLMQYLDRYSPQQARRHEVLPGITGWAQIHGRNALTWEQKFALDVWYVDHRSFWLDLKILARTLLAVVRREGISADGHATMPEFRGTPR